MLDLEIESAEEPAEDAAAAGEIDGGLHLVDGPVGFHSCAALNRDGEIGLADAVGELEHHAEDYAADERGYCIDAQHRPDRVQQDGDAEVDGEERDLAADEDEQVLAARA